MAATIWTKFFWADWLSDAKLRRCSPAARGVWMDLLCVAAQHDPIGYLCVNGESLTTSDMARIAGVSEAEVVSLMAELIRNGVCSRDGKGRLYSRRMVRDAQRAALSKKKGQIGGRVSRDKQRGIFEPSKGAFEPRVQTPEAKPAVAARAPLLLACQVMGIGMETLRRKPAWMAFGDLFAELVGQGCNAELDIWPTIASVHGRSRVLPASPRYFKAAILDARDKRVAEAAPSPASARAWDERLAVFEAEGVWSSKWGPKPGEAGCLAPASNRKVA